MDRVIRSTERTASSRIDRHCFACCLRIREGDRYVETALAGASTAWSIAEHAQCRGEVLRSIYLAGDDTYDHGYLHDLYGEDPEYLSAEWRDWYEPRKEAENE